MPSSIFYRLLGQGVTLTVHAGNSAVMFLSMQDENLIKDPQINQMTSMQSTYLTVWNISFQLFYFFLAFSCDFLTVMGKENLIPKSIRSLRRTFFSAIGFPIAASIFTIFWPIFIINRELLFPAFIDQIFSIRSNLIIHFFILPAVLWELAFLPRPVPKSHGVNLTILLLLLIGYLGFVFHIHSKRGLFPYPIFTMTYGTIYFPMFIAAVVLITVALYYYQWKLTAFFVGTEKKKTVSKIKK